MTNETLAESYLRKAEARLKALAVLKAEGAYSDVIREAQELVELALKGVLRAIGVEPPKIHDVGPLLLEYRKKILPKLRDEVAGAAEISKRLRKERELAFYGDLDFVPTEEYTKDDAERAYADAERVLAFARRAISSPRS
jgi:hypothetical protein